MAEYEENTMRIRRKYDENTIAPPKPLASNALALAHATRLPPAHRRLDAPKIPRVPKPARATLIGLPRRQGFDKFRKPAGHGQRRVCKRRRWRAERRLGIIASAGIERD